MFFGADVCDGSLCVGIKFQRDDASMTKVMVGGAKP
jgi:hypothetical protein